MTISFQILSNALFIINLIILLYAIFRLLQHSKINQKEGIGRKAPDHIYIQIFVSSQQCFPLLLCFEELVQIEK
jgi:hypothetical protein